MNKEELKNRTKFFALEVFKLCNELPNQLGFNEYKRQLVRCSSSVGANYRAACRAKSSADFINKLKIVEEETDESVFFLELLFEIDIQRREQIQKLINEGSELLAIFVASINTMRKRKASKTA